MTNLRWTHEELDAAIARERKWIAARMMALAADIDSRCLDYDNADEIRELAEDIAKGIYPRPLTVDPQPKTAQEKTDADQ